MSYYVLADCNNFYASCERLFKPRLEKKPIIVLSNNDGCVVARSQEAKDLGIKMGVPFFQIRKLCEITKVEVFSSNYQLYGDISERVMHILSNEAPEYEIYSIDEIFLKYPVTLSPDFMFSECLRLRKLIRKWTGMPISLGISTTKTLAKMANDLSKKNREVGVFNLLCPTIQMEVLKKYPIGDVWGIGRRLVERLYEMGIVTAWDFKEADPYAVRKKMGVVGERMLWELRGISCLPLTVVQPRKSITSSRSFGKIVTQQEELAEALATFVSKACVRLRAQKSCASGIYVYLEALLDAKEGSRKTYGQTRSFALETSDTSLIISQAKEMLSKIYIRNEKYKKCGVVLLDLIDESNVIPDLFLGGMNQKILSE